MFEPSLVVLRCLAQKLRCFCLRFLLIQLSICDPPSQQRVLLADHPLPHWVACHQPPKQIKGLLPSWLHANSHTMGRSPCYRCAPLWIHAQGAQMTPTLDTCHGLPLAPRMGVKILNKLPDCAYLPSLGLIYTLLCPIHTWAQLACGSASRNPILILVCALNLAKNTATFLLLLALYGNPWDLKLVKGQRQHNHLKF